MKAGVRFDFGLGRAGEDQAQATGPLFQAEMVDCVGTTLEQAQDAVSSELRLPAEGSASQPVGPRSRIGALGTRNLELLGRDVSRAWNG